MHSDIAELLGHILSQNGHNYEEVLVRVIECLDGELCGLMAEVEVVGDDGKGEQVGDRALVELER